MKDILYTQKWYAYISLVLALLFGLLTYFVYTYNEVLLSLNENIFLYLISTDIASEVLFWKFVTFFGGPIFLGIATAVCAIYFFLKHDIYDALVYAGGMLGGLILVVLFKYFTAIERPEYIHRIEESFSFPSGHTALTTIFVFLTVYVYIRLAAHSHRYIGLCIAVVLSLIIAYSRLMLGEHWLTDIVGGYLLAGAWVSAVIFSFGRVEKLSRLDNTHK
jgi:membrane-associated phospholipid phosphatase